MKLCALLVLSGLVAVGVFGFAGMNMDMDHGSGTCIASLVNVVACPMEAFSSAIYHIEAYASFSLATLSTSLVLLSLVLLALLAARLERLKLLVPRPAPISRIDRSRYGNDSYTKKQLRWLSRFENSPSVICGA